MAPRNPRNRSNTIRTDGDSAYIELTQEKEAIVDLKDLDLVKDLKWHAVKTSPTRWYAKAGRVYLHRVVLNVPAGEYVDHINGNGLDNRKSNLRAATNQQNAQNKTSLDPRSRTGVRGVSTHKTADGTLYYVAKVSVTRYFPHTDEGFEQARQEAITMREVLAAMKRA